MLFFIRSTRKKVAAWLIIFGVPLCLLASFFLPPSLPEIPMPSDFEPKIETLVQRIRNQEERINPKVDTEKKFIFYQDKLEKTKISFLYLHGFSATRKEVSPVFETVSRDFDSNLFLTRFTGHGLGPEELGKATKLDWLKDSVEALGVSQKIGDRTIIGCVSTGCALAIYLAYYFPQKIEALILMSPNFSPADSRAFLANGPLGRLLTKVIIGPYRTITPINAGNAYYWTMRYGSAVIPEMVSLVTAVKNFNLEKIKTPTLTLYTPFDDVISVKEIEKTIPKLGGTKNKTIVLAETKEHLIAGDIFNPQMNSKVIEIIEKFIREIESNKNIE